MRKSSPKRKRLPAIVRVPGVLVRIVEDECFLIDTEAGTIHHMNRLGYAVWRLLARPSSRQEITATIMVAFPDVPAERIRGDLDRLLKTLFEDGLVERTAAPKRQTR